MTRAECRRIVRYRAFDRCEGIDLIPSVTCWGGPEVHELKRRSQGGDPNDPDGCRLLCSAHHEWVTTHPADAHDAGLTVWSWEN